MLETIMGVVAWATIIGMFVVGVANVIRALW